MELQPENAIHNKKKKTIIGLWNFNDICLMRTLVTAYN